MNLEEEIKFELLEFRSRRKDPIELSVKEKEAIGVFDPNLYNKKEHLKMFLLISFIRFI